jgi:hypothetical protein
VDSSRLLSQLVGETLPTRNASHATTIRTWFENWAVEHGRTVSPDLPQRFMEIEMNETLGKYKRWKSNAQYSKGYVRFACRLCPVLWGPDMDKSPKSIFIPDADYGRGQPKPWDPCKDNRVMMGNLYVWAKDSCCLPSSDPKKRQLLRQHHDLVHKKEGRATYFKAYENINKDNPVYAYPRRIIISPPDERRRLELNHRRRVAYGQETQRFKVGEETDIDVKNRDRRRERDRLNKRSKTLKKKL